MLNGIRPAFNIEKNFGWFSGNRLSSNRFTKGQDKKIDVAAFCELLQFVREFH